MKPFILLAVLLLALSYCSFVLSTFPRSIAGVNHDFEDLDDEAVIERINLNNPSWTAGVNREFEGKRVRDLKYLLGVELEDDEEMFSNATAPESRKIQETCGGVNCGTLSCCNGACYNAAQYTCSNDQLCPYGMSACGRACYNPTQYHCVNGNLVLGAESSTPSPSPSPSPSPTPSPSPSPSPAPTPSSSESSTEATATSFDARTKWPSCMGAIKSQGSCGGCWAFSAGEVLADRICIATNGATKVVLSSQYQLNCNSYNLACKGGYMSKTWTFLAETGTTTETCTPYVSSTDTSNKACSTSCTGSGSFVRYRANSSTIKKYASTDLSSVMTDISTNGPVHASFYVYSDFYYYKSGVYTHTYGSLQAGHAIKIVGWGTDSASGLPYWIVANSWGASWGMNGYFWIKRGSNDCSIEGSIYSAKPL